jgi:hypothetical protein
MHTGGLDVRQIQKTGWLLVLVMSLGWMDLQASSFVNPAFKLQQGDLSIGTGFVHSRVDYEISNTDRYIQRAVLGADLAYGLSRYVDLFADFGLTLQSELEQATTDGSGFLFGAGARGIVHKYNSLSVFGVGGFTYQIEDYASRLDGSHFEINLGGFLGYELNPIVDLFAGLDAVPYSDGEIEIDGFNSDSETDIDQLLSLRFGSNIEYKNITFRPEISLFAKRNFALHASTTF